MNTKAKIVVVLVAILLIFSYFIYRAIDKSASYYYTLSELKSTDLSGKQLRVKGTLVKESVVWNPEKTVLRFSLSDGTETMEMVYNQVMPDNFDHAKELIVEGNIMGDNQFQVNKLMLQCPSKYEEASETSKGGE